MSAEILEPEALPPEIASLPVARSAVTTLAARGLDLPCRYGFHLLVAWRLGVVDAGAFYIIFSMVTLAAGAGRIGIDRAMTRDIARMLALGDHRRARAMARDGLMLTAALSSTVTVAVLLAAPTLASVFHRAELTAPIRLAASAIPGLCVSAAAAGALAGLHRVPTSQMIYSWLWPAIFCAMALVMPLDLKRAFAFMAVATWLGAALSIVLLRRALPAYGERRCDLSLSRHLLPLGWSLFSTEVVQLAISALPALVLGIVADEQAVGRFALAWRLALVINLLVVAIAAIASPRFAALAARGDDVSLRRTATDAVRLALIVGIVPVLLLTVAAPLLLGLFGAGFAGGATTLRILLIAQTVTMLVTATPELLGMTGHEQAMQRVNTVSILLFVPVLALFAHGAGSEGAAAAILVVSLVNAGGATLLVRRHLGFVPLALLCARGRQRRTATPAHGQ